MSGHLSSALLAELDELLLSCFAADELRRFIGGLPNGKALTDHLPGEAVSRAELVAASLALSQRHGLLEMSWFEAMSALRPARANKIQDLGARVVAELAEEHTRQTWPLVSGIFLRRHRYRLVRRIGSGSYGDVWEADDTQANAPVAIKFLRWSGDLLDENRRRRFFEGAEEMAAVEHPSVVKVLEKRCEEGGHDFYVMEFVDGRPLRDIVLAGKQSSISLARAIKILRGLGDALVAVHKAGIVHRDLSPNNAMISDTNEVKLIDFDLVRRLEAPGTRTSGGGTWVYTAPEMDTTREIDARADIFGLAMIGVFMLHGAELPLKCYHERELPGFITRLRAPPRLRITLLKASAWEPDGRYKTMAEFCKGLALADTGAIWWLDRVRILERPGLWFGLPILLAVAGAVSSLLIRPPGLIATHPNLTCAVKLQIFTEGNSRTKYVIPNRCDVVHAQAWGGGGGGAGHPGGSGGFAEARLRVEPTEVLTVAVGSGGAHWGRGGGADGTGGALGGAAGFAGASSGGYSGVQIADFSWLLVAGGGGGASAYGPGGGGGGESGEDGMPYSVTRGLGGGQAAPGKGGDGFHGGSSGSDGTDMKGGSGGRFSNSNKGDYTGVGGGAGGGGYKGGGGGGGDGRDIIHEGTQAGAGGGGSGYVRSSSVVDKSWRLVSARGTWVPAADDRFYRDHAGQGGRAWPNVRFDPITHRPLDDEGASGNPGRVVLVTLPHLSLERQ